MLQDLYALAYISIALEEFDKAHLIRLAAKANEKNKKLDISGYLCFKHNMFFQYLEGSKAHLQHLMDEISLDDRHQMINLIQIGNIQERKFMGWSMRFLDDELFKDVCLEDMLNWILTSIKTQDMAPADLESNVQSMIEQIRVLRGQKAIH